MDVDAQITVMYEMRWGRDYDLTHAYFNLETPTPISGELVRHCIVISSYDAPIANHSESEVFTLLTLLLVSL